MKKIYSLLILACLGIAAQAQVSNYTFSQTIGSYGSVNTGTMIGPLGQDDDVTTVNLPFTFNFNGTNYTSVNVSSNGFLSFDMLIGTEYFPLSDPTTSNVISAFGQDLIAGVVTDGDLTTGSNSITNVSQTGGFSVGDSIVDWNGDFNAPFPIITQISGSTIVLNTTANNTQSAYFIVGVNGTIRHNVTGSQPNRIAEFEFQKFTRFNGFDEVINFKIRLYETTNKIEFVYGPIISDPQFNSSSEVGLKGNSQSDFNSRTVKGSNNWSTSTAATAITDSIDFSLTSTPPVGLIYTWLPGCNAPVLAVTQSSASICAGQSATLLASGATTYSWVNGGTTAQQIVTPTVSTTYTLIGSSNNCSASLTVQQSVTPNPTITIAQTSSAVCTGSSATLTAVGASSYSWTNNGAGAVIVVTPTSNTAYTVTGISSGCSSSTTINQVVLPKPALAVTQSQTLVCTGANVTLTASGANNYSWNTGSVTAQIVVNPTTTTNYTVSGTNTEGCASTYTFAQAVSACQGITTNSIFDNISVFPNPFNDKLTISNSNNFELTVRINDALGKTVSVETSNGDLTLNTSSLNSGVYLVTISTNGESVIKKIIKD